VAATGEGMLVQPHSGDGENGHAANPTDYLLVLGALKSDKEVQGVVEIFQRSGGRPTVERGYLRFLTQMCDLAGDYLKTRRLRSFADRQIMWSQLEQFTRLVHESLDPRHTAYTIANEGRRLIGCDRVSVALKRGNRCRIEAISGQELLDNRSNTVTLLGKLSTVVVAGGEDLWYNGDTSNLPPQIEESVETYADEAHSKMVAVLPLERPREEAETDDDQKPPEFLGALVIEQITEDVVTESMRRRIDVVADHSALALSNAREHHDLFLMPVWRAIGKSRWMVQARTLPKTLAITGAVLALLLVLFLWPMRFQLSGKGTLQPVKRHDVFAAVDGIVETINVREGDKVTEGQVLAVMVNHDLDVKIDDVTGQLNTATDQLISGQRRLSSGSRLPADERAKIEGDIVVYTQQAESFRSQLKLLNEKKAKLEVKSPIKGQVVSWHVKEHLNQRPVKEGDLLMSVSNDEGDWHLEVQMPEDRMGYVLRAQREKREAAAKEHAETGKEVDSRLDASYILATNPGTRHYGKVIDIVPSAHVEGEEGNVVLVKISLDKSDHDLVDLRQGAAVTAKIDCGTASVGYCWFHDLIAFVQSRILFKFF
jgi:biotin carboxyl carrier protein